jgi:hypothetical protein
VVTPKSPIAPLIYIKKYVAWDLIWRYRRGGAIVEVRAYYDFTKSRLKSYRGAAIVISVSLLRPWSILGSVTLS